TFWDYDSGLSKQQIIFARPIPSELLSRMATELIPNLDELIHADIHWSDGYRGTVQLVLLLLLSELMRERDSGHAA
ncbi:MAG: hypothetical protein ACRD3W_14550, partial [Terriglobales bacterium]